MGPDTECKYKRRMRAFRKNKLFSWQLRIKEDVIDDFSSKRK